MPKAAKMLSAKAVENLRPVRGQTIPQSYAVGGESPGLYLQVAPSGGKSWLLRITVGKRPHPTQPGVFRQLRREFGLGRYPDVPLKDARAKAEEVRVQIARGCDPITERKVAASAALAEQARQKTFEECEKATLEVKRHGLKGGKTAALWRSRFDTYVHPVLGKRIVGEITTEEVAAVLLPIWHTKYPTADKLRKNMKAVFDYAKASKYRIGDNPAELKGGLDFLLGKSSHVEQHHPALPYVRAAEFMRALAARGGNSARALEFQVLTAARPGEVRDAPWSEFDLEKKVWRIPAERMKNGRVHRVPLSDAALSLLERQQAAGYRRYPFENTQGSTLSDAALPKLIKDMHAANIKAGGPGYLDPHCGQIAVAHGWRSSFKDWARSETQHADEVSELALSHVDSDSTRAAYARDELLGLRAELMSDWAKFCYKTPSA